MKTARISAVAFFLASIGTSIPASVAIAQITTDGSVGPAMDLVGPDFVIPDTLGIQVGANLFHSFGDFNVNTGESATFTSGFAGPTDNVIARISGSGVSTVDGLLASAIPAADLWLVNPNGVVFGENASLDVQGSFVVGSADYLAFEDGGRFGTALGNPSDTLLTAASPRAFGFLGNPAGQISMTGSVISIQAGERISVYGGDIVLTDTILDAPAGGLHIGSVAGPGEIGLPGIDPAVTTVDQFGDVTFTRSLVGTTGDGGSRITIRGGRFVMQDVSLLTSQTANVVGSDISVHAETVSLTDGSIIETRSSGDGRAGNIHIAGPTDTAGNDIPAASIVVDGNGFFGGGLLFSVITSDADGTGASAGGSGDISIFADNVSLQNVADGLTTWTVDGTGGDIAIRADQVAVLGQSFLATLTSGSGQAGDITIAGSSSPIADRINVADAGSLLTSRASGIGAGAGGPGDIAMVTRELVVSDGGNVGTRNVDGSAGLIDIRADELDLVGIGSDISAGTSGTGAASDIRLGGASSPVTERLSIDGTFSGIFSESDSFAATAGSTGNVEIVADRIAIDAPLGGIVARSSGGTGEHGSVSINVRNLDAVDGQVSTVTLGSGSAGDITIQGVDSIDELISPAESVNLNGAQTQITSESMRAFDAGAAGTVTITAAAITLDGGADISATTQGGQGGSIVLNVDQLDVGDPGADDVLLVSTVSASTNGIGNAGNILVQGSASANGAAVPAASVTTAGFGSGITSSSLSNLPGSGDAGGVVVMADSVHLTDGSQIGAVTFSGDGGSVTLAVDELRLAEFGNVSTNSFGSGDAGDIGIHGTGGAGTAASLVDLDKGEIVSESDGAGPAAGAAGDIDIRAAHIALHQEGFVSVQTSDGQGGDIVLNVDTLDILDGDISARTDGTGDAGRIVVRGSDSTDALVTAADSVRVSGILADIESLSGAAGNDAGTAGNIIVHADSLVVEDFAVISAETVDGRGGSIVLEVGSMSVTDRARILAETTGGGQGGDIEISGSGAGAELRVQDARISSGNNAIGASGNAGTVTIDIDSLLVSGDPGGAPGESGISSESIAEGGSAGAAGSIRITASQVDVNQNGDITATTIDGAGGVIEIEADSLSITSGGAIVASTSGSGDAGGILVARNGPAGGTVTLDGGSIRSRATADGGAGSVRVRTDDLQMLNSGEISVDASGAGAAGAVILDLQNLAMVDSLVDVQAANAPGGNVDARIADIVTLNRSRILASAAGLAEGDSGGNVTISDARFVVLSQSRVSADANVGAGGAIDITTDTFVMSADSLITATSTQNVDGTINIDAINQFTGNVADVEAPVIDAPAPIRERCTLQQIESRSSLIVESVRDDAIRPDYRIAALPPTSANSVASLAAAKCTGSDLQ